jgi:nicotinamidase-related amidase
MTAATPRRFTANQSSLLVVDVQDKLLGLIDRTPIVIGNIRFLLDAAALLDVPVLATEQYPQGLGQTAPAIAERLPLPIPSKTTFSCLGAGSFREQLAGLNRPAIVVSGIETHICVMQTSLDLLERGSRVLVAVDAVASRHHLDHEMALRRLEREGAWLTTSEAIVFEWLGDAKSPAFKAASALVQDRSRRLRELESC